MGGGEAELANICYKLEEGVYRYEPGEGWRRVYGEPKPSQLGMVLIFVNVYCRDACLEVMRVINSKVGWAVESRLVSIWLIVCTKFRRLCWSEDARRLFYIHKVYGSPTVVVTDSMGIVVGALKGPYMVSRNIESLLDKFAMKLKGEAVAVGKTFAGSRPN